MAPEFLKNLRQTGSLGQTARNAAEDLLVPPIVNAVRQYGQPKYVTTYDPVDATSPEARRAQRLNQNLGYDLRHKIDSEPIKDKAFYESMDKSLADVKNADDVNFTKDFNWTDESGKTHHWRIGYKNKMGEYGPVSYIATVYDKDSEADPVFGKESLKKFFSSNIKPGSFTYTIDDLGWASGGPIYEGNERSATPGYGALPNRTYNPKSYGSTYNYKTAPSIWSMFPSGYH